MKADADTKREQLSDALRRFDRRVSAGNMSLREFSLFFSYINWLLCEMDGQDNRVTRDIRYWQEMLKGK